MIIITESLGEKYILLKLPETDLKVSAKRIDNSVYYNDEDGEVYVCNIRKDGMYMLTPLSVDPEGRYTDFDGIKGLETALSSLYEESLGCNKEQLERRMMIECLLRRMHSLQELREVP